MALEMQVKKKKTQNHSKNVISRVMIINLLTIQYKSIKGKMRRAYPHKKYGDMRLSRLLVILSIAILQYCGYRNSHNSDFFSRNSEF